MMSPLEAPIEKLKELAAALFAVPERPHWSVAAATLGRIVDEKLYGNELFGAYETAEQYAKDSLDMAAGEFRLHLKLWRVIQRCKDAVAFEEWRKVSKSRALLLGEVLEVGADPREWFDKLVDAEDAATAEQLVRQRLGQEVWVDFKARVPLASLETIEGALERAVGELKEADLGPADEHDLTPWEIAMDRRWRHMVLEAVCRHYLETAPTQLPLEAPDPTEGQAP